MISFTRTLKAGTAFAALALATPALADTVTLKSSDGTVDLTGEFVAFEENAYVIRTALGELRLSAERVSCIGDACPSFESAAAEANLLIKGSDTVGLGIMPLLLEGYAGYQDAEATIISTGNKNELLANLVSDGGFGDDMGSLLVTSTTSGDAFTNLLDETAQIGMASRRIKPEEARALRDAGAGNMISPDQEHIVAVDSIVVITNPGNPVQRLTMTQLAAIYTGQVTNWSQVGGPDLPIQVVGRQEDSGTSAIFYRTIMGEANQWRFAEDMIVAEDNNTAAALVNNNEGAIGFVGYAFQRGAKPLSLVNSCGLTMTPDAFSARTEEYELQRRLYLYNRADTMTPEARDLLDYALSDQADAVIRKAGFIDLGIEAREQSLDGDRARALLDPNADPYEGSVMREMLGQMVDYDRLSTTFRFRTGSASLDERGRIDMERLADYLEDVPAGSQVMFVGFTDDVGPFDANRELSRARAEQVMADMRAYAGSRLNNVDFKAAGYGEVAPSGCNTSDRGRAINRRVEVWINAPT
ncbi:phosphate ABC transporter substrate-binding/OmpA family protein [Jannaschia aquimarina]|uniref:PstS1 protein n=1 Tax=Jannaschia aquimarina TaxID=935700 RepID=A0A0D1D8Z1_9RHOB|nr:phosphate ABC transporter substrate-binding/OmpA family protein [Jannaschia aquimarina]KIT16363.1 Phosphate-binding protein PstS 1 precursor [Jannaschia aquimarina]SNT25564.1 phosphate ABC transporter substrate-binding protein, PhoT family [Jannaschia aquimarina]